MGQEELLSSVLELAQDFAKGSLRPTGREAERDAGPSDALRQAFQQTGLETVALPEPMGAGLGVEGLYAVTRTLAAGDPGLAAALMAPAWFDRLSRQSRETAVALVLDPLWQTPSPGGQMMALASAESGEVLYLAPASAAVGHLVARRATAPVGLTAAGLVGLGGEEMTMSQVTVEAPTLWREAVLWPISLMLGAASAALGAAVTYAATRRAFGQPLTAYQGVTFPLADAATSLEAADSLTERAIWLHTSGSQEAQMAMLKALVASRTASFKAGDEAVQTLGGAGFVSEFPVELWFRDAVAAGALTGQIDHYTLLIGQEAVS